MTKDEIYNKADLYVKNQPLVNANRVELKRGFMDGATWMQKKMIECAVQYIMETPAYAVQPEVYAEGLRKAMEE